MPSRPACRSPGHDLWSPSKDSNKSFLFHRLEKGTLFNCMPCEEEVEAPEKKVCSGTLPSTWAGKSTLLLWAGWPPGSRAWKCPCGPLPAGLRAAGLYASLGLLPTPQGCFQASVRSSLALGVPGAQLRTTHPLFFYDGPLKVDDFHKVRYLFPEVGVLPLACLF